MVQINLDDTIAIWTGLALLIGLVVYFVKLEFRIRCLEGNPFLDALKDIHKQDAIRFYRQIRNMKEEKGEMTNVNMVELTPEEIKERERLLNKYELGELEVREAERLKKILEKEKQRAVELGDIVLIFGIALLLTSIIDYLSDKKNPLRKLFK
jgi:hypothetical protein